MRGLQVSPLMYIASEAELGDQTSAMSCKEAAVAVCLSQVGTYQSVRRALEVDIIRGCQGLDLNNPRNW